MGYQVLHIENLRNRLAILNQEHIRLIIMYEMDSRMEDQTLIDLCRLFKRQTGITCNRYLSVLRIEKAKQLLRKTELSVTEVSSETGFNSITHFERVFKSLEGTTPSAYRRRD